jgi:hypothetical protein
LNFSKNWSRSAKSGESFSNSDENQDNVVPVSSYLMSLTCVSFVAYLCGRRRKTSRTWLTKSRSFVRSLSNFSGKLTWGSFGACGTGFAAGARTCVTTPLWAKCEDETHIPESGGLESSRTLKNLELDCRVQNTLNRGVLYINGKVLKYRCPKWPRMIHLDIFSPSYGQKKGRESNWQFDSRPLKVGNRSLPNICRRSARWHWKVLEESYNFDSDLTPIRGRSQEMWVPKVSGVQPGTVLGLLLGSPGKKCHSDVALAE